MPDLDYAILCEHARAEGGVMHMIAGSIDTLAAAELPQGFNLAIASRILFARSECDRPHRIEFLVQTEDAQFARISGTVEPQWNDNLPAHWKVGVQQALRFGLTLEQEGLYDIDVLINDSLAKTIPFRVTLRESAQASDG